MKNQWENPNGDFLIAGKGREGFEADRYGTDRYLGSGEPVLRKPACRTRILSSPGWHASPWSLAFD